MSSRNSDYNDYRKVVTIDNPIYQSFKGRYFIGQSDLLNFGCDTYAFGALYNPPNSGVDLYISVTTITNTSNIAIKSRTYLNAIIPKNGCIVEEITPSNLTTVPLPNPEALFITGYFKECELWGGVKAFTRMVSPQYTLANEKDGKIVIPEGGNIMLVLVPPENGKVQCDIAYGWWEIKKCK